MADAITLTVPAVPPTVASYAPVELRIKVFPEASIVAILRDNTGSWQTFTYPTASTVPPAPPALYDTPAKVLTLIAALNVVNLSTRSLWLRLFDRLVIDFADRFPGGATVG